MSIAGVSEGQIARFLIDTPGFFERHAEALAAVRLTSPHGMRAVSLQERQMEMLRERIKGLEKKIVEMIRNGQDNVAIADRLRNMICNRLSLAIRIGGHKYFARIAGIAFQRHWEQRAFEAGGGKIEYWDINVLDVASGVIIPIFPPQPEGISFGDPSLAQTNDNFLVLDYVDLNQGIDNIVAIDLFTGDANVVLQNGALFSPGLPPSLPYVVYVDHTRAMAERGERLATSMSTHGVHAGSIEDMWQVSIETAQSKLDLTVLDTLKDKTIILGVLDLSNMHVETTQTVAARIGVFPISMCRKMFSRITMLSSTNIPTTNDKAISVIRLSEKPKICIMIKVGIIADGIATNTNIELRKL